MKGYDASCIPVDLSSQIETVRELFLKKQNLLTELRNYNTVTDSTGIPVSQCYCYWKKIIFTIFYQKWEWIVREQFYKMQRLHWILVWLKPMIQRLQHNCWVLNIICKHIDHKIFDYSWNKFQHKYLIIYVQMSILLVESSHWIRANGIRTSHNHTIR